MEAHPVRIVVTDDRRRSRLTVLFRLLLALPHLVWLVAWTLGAAAAAIVGWLVALVRGRVPDGVHGFLAAYVRYSVHVGAYLSLAAGPYPGFLGERGYPVDVDLPAPAPQRRWTVALRLVLALPALFVAAVLVGAGDPNADDATSVTTSATGVLAGVAVLAWFACLATGRAPLGLRNLAAWCLRYAAQAAAYVLLLTDRYPDSDPELPASVEPPPPHPVSLRVDDDLRRSRLTVFFRLLLAFPHLVWLVLWSVAAVVAASVLWLVVLARGRGTPSLHRFLAALVRYSTHLGAFLTLVANPFPGFTGAPGYPVDPELPPPGRQGRWVTGFRLFLALPALLLSGVLGVVLVPVAVLGWFAALLTGRMPRGLRNAGAYALRYSVQVSAYLYVLTDRYPHASPPVEEPPPPEPDRVAAPASS